MIRLENYINGELKAPVDGKYLDNYNPSIGEVYSLIPDSDHTDVEEAVSAANQAFSSWSVLPAAERSRIMMAIADLIDRDADKLALAESIDNGKPLKLAKTVDIPRASANMRFFATAILHTNSSSHQMGDQAINYTTKTPAGVAVCISPWNLPLYLFTWKIAPALAAGTTVVAKPSEITPMTAYLFSQLCVEAGLPSGVLNVVHGLGHKVGQEMVAHPDVSLISFTGGTSTGKQIAATAAPMFKKLSLELGGKNPNIVFDDCDFEQAVDISVKSAFTNQGQICLCGSRIFVEDTIYDRFVSSFVKKVEGLKVGDPLEGNIDLGAISSLTHMRKVIDAIQLAKEEGGQVLTGGQQLKIQGRCENGYFLSPTVITGLDYSCQTNQQEIFGPVVTIMPFSNAQQVIEFANGTIYGLSATIWTNDLKKAHLVANNLKCGVVWVNCWMLRDLRTPFGGMKSSGMGREGGWEALNFFTEQKNICINLQ